MTDPVTLGLLLTVALILVVVITLLFTTTPLRRRPARGAAAAFHLLLLGKKREARDLLAEVVRSVDAPPEAFLRLGDLLREEGEATRALALHQGLLARPQLDPELRRLSELSVADDLLALGRPEEAEQRLARLDEQFLDEALLARHANALHRLGRVEDAAEVLGRRARLSGGEAAREAARYLAELARESFREGNFEMARERARRAARLDPSVAVADAVEGDVLVRRDRLEEALGIWQRALRRSPGSGRVLLPRMLDAAFRAGRLEGLVAELEELRQELPEDVAVWRAVADLRLRRGDLESFFALVESPPEAAPADPVAWAGWVRHLSALEDLAPLRRLLTRLPDAFGPRQWSCGSCGAVDPEPRVACMGCGALRPLRPVATELPSRPLALPGGSR